ncbi:MAG: tetratricopeptide repeat protein [Tidjanibacter sp.]|nr:tetratricopeptide repeat protein [Tidjanibacter sp.]
MEDISHIQVELLIGQGKDFYSRGDFGAAINCFNEALRIDPSLTEAREWLTTIDEILAFRHKDYYNP